MDVDFMVSDSIEVRYMLICQEILIISQAVRPKLTFAKTLEEAAAAVDEMFSSAFQETGEITFRT